LNFFTRPGKEVTDKTISREINFQISADLLILTTILHFSGGIENPFFFFFVFHMIIASVMLSRLQSYIQATLAALLFGILVYCEYSGVLPHYDLSGLMKHSYYQDGFFVFVTYMVFISTLYLVVYMTNSISGQLRKQQDDYEQANILLQKKDDLKDEYVLRLTHDIRGHLAAIQGCLNIVDNGMAGPLNQKQQDLVDRSYKRTTKCMAFISALLKLTRMRLTGQLDMEYFSLKNTFFDAIATVQSRANKKTIKINYELLGEIDEIYGEPILIEEAITNLLFNAIRYSPANSEITIKAYDKPRQTIIEVIDSGIGVPPAEIDKIFEEFYRAENARKVERDGTGLGLSIVKQVVERHHGTITVKNNADAGCTFTISFPKVISDSITT
jgi:signal transduction histidine kinase